MAKSGYDNIFKNIYDDSTLDTLRALHSSIIAVMRRNKDFKDYEITLYERVPIKPGAAESHIRVNVSKNGVSKSCFLKEDFITKVEDSEDIRPHVATVMDKLKSLF